MGLNSIGKVQDTATIELRNPEDGKPIPGPNKKPMSVTLYGPYSKTYKRAMREMQQARISSGGAAEMTYEESDAMQTDLLIACIIEWNVALDTDALPCDPDTVQKVFDEHPWVRDQLQIAHGSVARFLAKPKPH
jgi:hypothetical protein